MLRSPKNSVLHLAPPSHVDVFVDHYDQLKKWALRFTENDQEAAEDLLHDTFINLTISRPDLTAIQNLEGYLFIVMRNLHLSQVRRAMRLPVRSFSVVEYDTAEMPFWASDPREHLRMRDELAAVCRIACIRKESSKGGSLLILRFFHGYYPEEIAEIMRTTRTAVNSKLKKVRVETKLFIEEPERFRMLEEKLHAPISLNTTFSGDDLRLQLRSYIFKTRQGNCISESDLDCLYVEKVNEFPDHKTLAHIVSCESCIERVNTLLGLAPLASRYPVDMIGNDPGSKGGDSGGGAGTGGGGAGGKKPMLDSYINRRDAHFNHEPRELCIAVNGQFQGLQKIVSGKGELMLSIDTNESVGFVEVFSELGVRLLMLHVEPLPVGDGNQSTFVELSNGRTVEANLNFGSAFPSLKVSYNDPDLSSALDTSTAPALAMAEAISTESIPATVPGGVIAKMLEGFRFWLQPARLTAAFAALLIVSLVIFQLAPFTTVTASELLDKSAAAEATQLANKERVLHRTLDLEESKDGQVVSRKRIDIWQSSERGITARRLYDEQGKLAMGDWRNEKGIQTIYQRGQAAKLQPVPEQRKAIGFEDAWQLSLSAGEFKELVKVGDDTRLEERDNEYVINYQASSTTPSGETPATPPIQEGSLGGGSFIRASITLSKEDLHPIEQTFTLRVGDESRDYRMTEAAYEWRPANAVAPAVFEPNIELTGIQNSPPSKGGVDDASSDGVVVPANSNTNTTTVAPATIATAALEVEVIEALNNAGAFMGEQVNVSRTGDGKISVTAMVETADRKRALLTALSSVSGNPAVRIQIETVAEAEARIKKQQAKGTQPTTPGTVERVEVTEGQNPVLVELKKRFSDEEARRFADRVINRSRSARQHALAAKQLAERFSPADLQSLKPEERTRWLALIRGHADAFLRETSGLQRDLQQFFPEADAGASGGGAVTSDADIQRRTRELYDAAVSLDRGFGRSFALNAGGNANPPVTGSSFWRQFAQAVGFARSLSTAK